MKYYILAGEASGDLHASHLIASLKKRDPEAKFRGFGGDLMEGQGAHIIKHYKELAFMGFVRVVMNLRTILANLRLCKQDIAQWKPDVVILVDYPGFNLKIAQYVSKALEIPVHYYISPKIWAWKEYRIKAIKRDVDEIFSILPFEVDFYNKHNYAIHYVGNPTVDEVEHYKEEHHADSFASFTEAFELSSKPIIAILAGSRKQEIRDNLNKMIEVAEEHSTHQLVIAGAPGITREFYQEVIGSHDVHLVFGETYRLLSFASVALVTSGTATLEAALFKVPQVVCYHTPLPRLVSYLRKKILKVEYISLVNLIANYEVVRELVANDFTKCNLRKELNLLLTDNRYRNKMLEGYNQVRTALGSPGAPDHAAALIIEKLKINNC